MSELKELKNLYYLGPDGSNSYNAALKFLNICGAGAEELRRQPLKSIKQAFDAAQNDKISYTVLPVENSLQGLVRETIDCMLEIKDENLKVQGELVIPIKHALLASGDNAAKIKKIYSHPQALAQCGKFIYANFPDAELKEVSSTSFAAEKVSKDNDETQAAIASETCAEIFNLNVLNYNINDEKDNQTRFYIFGREQLKKTSGQKTALLLSPKVNRPGVLCDILKVIANYNINLTCIDSRPSKKHLGEYIFFMELSGGAGDIYIQKSIKELARYTDFVKVSGAFGRCE